MNKSNNISEIRIFKLVERPTTYTKDKRDCILDLPKVIPSNKKHTVLVIHLINWPFFTQISLLRLHFSHKVKKLWKKLLHNCGFWFTLINSPKLFYIDVC